MCCYNAPMRKRPEKTDLTKADLREAFWRLYAQQPIETITIQQICDAAGYNRGTFYLHYHDIYELLESIESEVLAGMTDCVERCMKRLAGDSSKVARVAALADVVKYYERNRNYVLVLLGAQGDPSFLIRLKDNLKPLWREYVIAPALAEDRNDTSDVPETYRQKSGEPAHSEQEIDLILEYTLSGALFMMSRWLQEPGDVSAYQIGHLIYDTAIRDVAVRVRA